MNMFVLGSALVNYSLASSAAALGFFLGFRVLELSPNEKSLFDRTFFFFFFWGPALSLHFISFPFLSSPFAK